LSGGTPSAARIHACFYCYLFLLFLTEACVRGGLAVLAGHQAGMFTALLPSNPSVPAGSECIASFAPACSSAAAVTPRLCSADQASGHGPSGRARLVPKIFDLEICDFSFGHVYGVLNVVK